MVFELKLQTDYSWVVNYTHNYACMILLHADYFHIINYAYACIINYAQITRKKKITPRLSVIKPLNLGPVIYETVRRDHAKSKL